MSFNAPSRPRYPPASVPYSAVVCIVLSEMSGTGSRELNSPLQLLRTSLVVIGILFVCDNLGFQVKSLIAGISIAGLCSQALLQDAFAFIALTVESPFQARERVRACACPYIGPLIGPLCPFIGPLIGPLCPFIGPMIGPLCPFIGPLIGPCID